MEAQIISALIACILILYFVARNERKKYKLEIQKLKDTLSNTSEATVIAVPARKRLLQRVSSNPRQRQSYTHYVSGRPLQPISSNPPPELYHSNPYWTKLSDYCRAEKKWTCEACGINLKNDKYYLDTHHILGRGYNSPQHLKVLCVGCHAKEKSPIDHSFMKTHERYITFINKYRKHRQ